MHAVGSSAQEESTTNEYPQFVAALVGLATSGTDDRVWRDLFNALPAAIYITDADGRIIFSNAAHTLWGRRPEFGKSKFCGSWKRYAPDGTPLPHDQIPMALALKEKRPIRGMEGIAERPDRTRIHFITHPTPLFDASGNLRSRSTRLMLGLFCPFSFSAALKAAVEKLLWVLEGVALYA